MKISKVHIQNFRCLEDVKIDFCDYTAFIGANGSGKSSVLYALDWFFNNREISLSDITRCSETDEPKGYVMVQVDFAELTDNDRKVLGPFGLAPLARFFKSWTHGESVETRGLISGGPGFQRVRASKSAEEFKQAYKALASDLELAPYTNRATAIDALLAWELDPSNRKEVLEDGDDDASALFRGKNPRFAECIQMVLVPASSDLAIEAAGSNNKSTLSSLVSRATTEAVRSAVADWENRFQEASDDLRTSIETTVADTNETTGTNISAKFGKFVEGGSVSFEAVLPEPLLDPTPDVSARVKIGETQFGLESRGHGTQRAVLISVLQSLAESNAGGSDGQQLVLAFEEPEIYQHPVRARHFAQVLTEISGSGNSQVVVATHSPYFIRPEQFKSLRRFESRAGLTKVSMALASNIGDDPEKVINFMQREIEGKFAESFFADVVVLVEGETDKVVLEIVAEKVGYPLEANCVSVIPVGSKQSLKLPYLLMRSLAIPVYTVGDGDKDSAHRKYPEDESKRNSALASHKEATDKIVKWLPNSKVLFGPEYKEFNDPTCVTTDWTLFADDLETELKDWEGFESQLETLGGRLRDKKPYKYRMAAYLTDSDIPETFTELVGAIRDLKE